MLNDAAVGVTSAVAVAERDAEEELDAEELDSEAVAAGAEVPEGVMTAASLSTTVNVLVTESLGAATPGSREKAEGATVTVIKVVLADSSGD